MAAKGSGKGLAFLRANISFDGEECLIWPFTEILSDEQPF